MPRPEERDGPRASWIGPNARQLTLDEFPDSWTVAFSLDEVDDRIRTRIALDTAHEPDEFEVLVIPRVSLYLESGATSARRTGARGLTPGRG